MTTNRFDRPNTIPWPPIILISSIAIGFIAQGIYSLSVPTTPLGDLVFGLGLMMIIVALLIDIAAMRTMQKAKTTIMPHKGSEHMVTTGVFAFSRNPIYLANAILIIGIGLVMGTFWHVFIMPFAAFATQKLAIEREEIHLEHKFGNNFRSYKKKVNRWI
ncbi:MAG: isoprenylcysteine carboxylmethyltransferase family protein [Ahrensia sp.]|nr:isoprenylcysteine carboxylmethyltransferase family protein [Ahrensia sp.]